MHVFYFFISSRGQLSMDPRFLHLTYSNVVASDIEESQIREVILQDENNLPALKDEVSRLRSALHAASAQYEETCVRISIYKSTISPVRRIPPEIIAEIFLLCCTEALEIPPIYTDPRFAVTQICSGWRKVAVGLPQLWNTYSIGSPDTRPLPSGVRNSWDGHGLGLTGTDDMRKLQRFQQRRLQREQMLRRNGYDSARELFPRAAPLPIDLRVSFPLELTSKAITDIVIPHLSLIRKLYIRAADALIRPLLQLRPGSVDSLEELTILGKPSDIPNLWDKSCTVLHAAPRLTRLTIDPPIYNLLIPWAQLTYVHITQAYMMPFIGIALLRGCIQLVECDLQIMFDDNQFWHGWKSTYTVTLPKLRILRVNGSLNLGPIATRAFYDRLVLPGLKDFTLPLNKSVIDVFNSFTARSSFDLDKLSMIMSYECPDVPETALQCVPSLVSLVFRSPVSPKTFDMISRYELVPRLESLELRYDQNLDERVVVAMIEARRPRGNDNDDDNNVNDNDSVRVLLRRCRVVIHRWDEKSRPAYVRYFDQWKKDGLDIDLKYL